MKTNVKHQDIKEELAYKILETIDIVKGWHKTVTSKRKLEINLKLQSN
jgi:hypothetical protein